MQVIILHVYAQNNIDSSFSLAQTNSSMTIIELFTPTEAECRMERNFYWINGSCRLCNCSWHGATCNFETGACLCKDNYIGTACEQCAENAIRFSPYGSSDNYHCLSMCSFNT